MSRTPPKKWQDAMDRAGLSSLRRLGDAVGAHASTISAMIYGDRETSPDTVAKVAEVLGVDVRTVSAWVGQARTVAEPYAPPAEASLLSRRQREAVDELIRAMVVPDGKEKRDGTAKTRAGDAGADVHELKPKPPTQEEIDQGLAAAHRTRPKGGRRP